MRALAIVLFPFLALACGGNVASSNGSSNGASNDDGDNENENPSRATPDGSYDLTFTSVTATPTYASDPPSVSPPSSGKNAVLHLDDATNPTTITPRWGRPSEFTYALSSSAMSVTLGGAIFSDATTFFVSDTWTDFEIDRAHDGALSGTFTATGTEEITEGDEIFEATLTGSGKIAADTTHPDVRLGTLPSYGLMPWEPIPVELAEPSSSSFDPNSLFSLSPATAEGTASFDASSLRGTVLSSNWTTTSANVVVQPLTDFAGLRSYAKTFPVTFFDPGARTPGFTFDGPDANPPKWDASSLISYLATDASCESGGCAKIGPLGNNGCAVPDAGIAGVLEGNASSLDIRYRILVGLDSSGGGGGTITPDSSVFSVETAMPGEAPSTQSFGFALSDLQTIPSTFGMTQATPWMTAGIPYPSDTVGFAIRFGSESYCGGPIFNENSTIVLIDSITTE
ncbi:MAG: hypothetical protein ACRELY_06220 [Polyangiaceae bacterium]